MSAACSSSLAGPLAESRNSAGRSSIRTRSLDPAGARCLGLDTGPATKPPPRIIRSSASGRGEMPLGRLLERPKPFGLLEHIIAGHRDGVAPLHILKLPIDHAAI